MTSNLPGGQPPGMGSSRPPSPPAPVPPGRQESGAPLLEVRDLVVHHGQLRALSGISLAVYPGEVLANPRVREVYLGSDIDASTIEAVTREEEQL